MSIFNKKTINNYGLGKNKISELVKHIGLNTRKYPNLFKLKQQILLYFY
jgi:hypothetical protein